MFWFTADQHFGHHKIIEYCQRPFSSTNEMDETLIMNHNHVVGRKDVVIHGGDFSFGNKAKAMTYVDKLAGNHVFLRGSHDYWLPKNAPSMWEKMIEGHYIVVCHYAMRVWPRSHYNSWQLFGHSHGKLSPEGKQHDIGVDNNAYRPISFYEIQNLMGDRPDNFNLVS